MTIRSGCVVLFAKIGHLDIHSFVYISKNLKLFVFLFNWYKQNLRL